SNIFVGARGEISANEGVGILSFGGDDTITNHGAIFGPQDALNLNNNGGNTIVNAGRMEGDNIGIAISGGGNSITNSGLIEGGAGIVFAFPSGTVDTIDNSGTIRSSIAGGQAILQFDSVGLDITNNGHIIGAIQFGNGDNVYDGTLGRVVGQVAGGSGNDTMTGGAAGDHFDGGAGIDTLEGLGGNDLLSDEGSQATIDGGSGNDTITMASFFNASDLIDGGPGRDTLILDGDYSAGVALGADTLTNVEKIVLDTGFSYSLTLNDANVAAGARMAVDASALGSSDAFNFNGSAETDGRFLIEGGAENDTLIGGAGRDAIEAGNGTNTIDGGGGRDVLTGGSGADTFVYGAVSDSTGLNHDTINGFDALSDTFHIIGDTVSAVDATVASGRLGSAHFDADLVSAIGAGQLAPHDAVLFTPTAGGLAGHTFLIVDANGVAGYQAGQDFVFDLAGSLNLSHLAASDFT
ncbi:MAG TPA: calcium-binding protein, partial [Rhizomicrobium sp.]|nr:calcium-binding protein [Rhizomicrobium sp.]